jgi:hypothetical protein
MSEPASLKARTRLSYGDIQRALSVATGRRMTRAVLDRLIRDYARQLPEPEVVGGARIWPAESIAAFRAVVERDQEVRR